MKNKKIIKKMTIGLSMLSIVPITVGITAYAAPSNLKNSQTNHPLSISDYVAKSSISKPIYDYGKYPIISKKNGFNYIQFDKSNTKREKGKWYNDYLKKQFLDYDIAINYKFASMNGWTKEEYLKFLIVKYEKYGQANNNKFGLIAKTPSDWVAWHKTDGDNMGSDFVDGHDSPVRPTWTGAEKLKVNNIDNTLNWYAYDGGISTFFLFDQNNLENGWKRLEFMNRIIPASLNEIKAETDKSKTKRNKYMVDGKLVDKLDPFKHHFYVTINGSDFVRDTNGWKVMVTNSDLKSAFTKILNPVVTDTTYNKNHDFLADRLLDASGDKKDIDEAYWDGKYSITHHADSFSALVKDKTFFFPREYINNQQGSYINSYGRKVNDADHYWEGGGFNWAYVEDGLGGHKIYKDIPISNDKDKTDQYGRVYGNWHHLFPSQKWFQSKTAIWKDKGFN